MTTRLIHPLFILASFTALAGSGCRDDVVIGERDGGGDGGTIAIDGGPTDAGGGLQWFVTCGDPVCGAGWTPDGNPLCTTETAGAPCGGDGTLCDLMDDCNANLVCARTDPRMAPGGCPISRRRFKQDVAYVDEARLRALHDEVVRLPLATYRYTSAPERTHLGFIIEDVEPSMSVDAPRDMVDLYGYASMAIAALQVQARQIDALEREVAELRARADAPPSCGAP